MTTALTVKNSKDVISFDRNESLIESWLRFIDRRENTAKAYTQAIKRFFIWLYKNSITDPCRDDIIRYRDEMKNVDKLAPATIKLNLGAVKLFFQWLSSEGVCTNVAFNIHAPKVTNNVHKRAALTVDEVRNVIDGVNTDTATAARTKLIVSILIVCGLRAMEVCNLDKGDIVRRQGKYFLRVLGKGQDEKKAVPLPRELAAKINLYIQQFRKDAADDAPLFVSFSPRCKGKRLSSQTVSKNTKAALVNADPTFKSRDYCCHSLRHSFASVAINHANDKGAKKFNISIRSIATCLRHASEKTTEIYLHTDEIVKNRTCDFVYSKIFG